MAESRTPVERGIAPSDEMDAVLSGYGASHPFVLAAKNFETAKTADDKDAAVRAMLQHSGVYETLHNPSADPKQNEQNRRLREVFDSQTNGHSKNTQSVLSLVRRAAYARGALDANTEKIYTAEFNKFIDHLAEDENPDMVATAGIALEHITLERATHNEWALRGLMMYAVTLAASPDSKNFARESDDMTNQEEALSLSRKCVEAAQTGFKNGDFIDRAVLDALATKYNIVRANGQSAEAEKERDAADPLLKQAIFVINGAEINAFHQKQLREHSRVLKP